jgi:hypothetical protein
VATLIDFTTAYAGGPGFYSGTGSTQLVPYVFPVALNGRPYQLDIKSNAFSRQFDDRVRSSVDQSTEPGEAAINTQGLWRRSQSSWHFGAGQEYSDTADSELFRFKNSKGVYVWDRGQCSLLPDTTLASASANSNLYMATASDRLYSADDQALKFTTDFVAFTTVTSTAASAIYSLASDGFNVFYSYANGDIDQTNAGISTSSAYITGIEAGYLAYVRGRFMVAGQGADKRKIWNITTAPGSSENNPTALFTHPNSDFNWVGFAGGQNNIYCAGYAGNKSLIYKTTIKPDGTALDIPTVAGELPLGEVVQAIDAYLGFIVIGLQNGLRFCSSDSDGNLVIGPLIETGSPVTAFSAIGKFIYFAYTNFDTVSTGIGRLDVSTQITTNQPVYASDLMATGQGAIVDIHEFDGKPVFTVAGLGAYRQHATDLVASGFLDSGIYRWGVPDSKFIPKWDLRTKPLKGSISVSVTADGGSVRDVGTQSLLGSLESTFNGYEDRVFEAEARIVFTRSATNPAEGPTLTRWLGRAYAAPLRSQLFSVPLLLHHRMNLRGKEYFFDVDDELTRLRDLVENPRVVSYQENVESFSVVVEDVRWQPVDARNAHNEWDWEGTCTVIMRSVR